MPAAITTVFFRTTRSAPGHVALIAPNGELTVDACLALRRSLRSAAHGRGLVVVDLFEVPSVDDAIVQVLVGAATRCAAHGGWLVVANAAAQPWLALRPARAAGALQAHRRGTPPLADLLVLLAP